MKHAQLVAYPLALAMACPVNVMATTIVITGTRWTGPLGGGTISGGSIGGAGGREDTQSDAYRERFAAAAEKKALEKLKSVRCLGSSLKNVTSKDDPTTRWLAAEAVYRQYRAAVGFGDSSLGKDRLLTVTYADGSSKTYPLSFVNLFNNIDTLLAKGRST